MSTKADCLIGHDKGWYDRTMKLLVTGADGFLGCNLVDAVIHAAAITRTSRE